MPEEQIPPEIAALNYEQALTALEEVVASLEREEHPLEEALALYARGQALLTHCRRLLAEAELKVQRLAGEDLAPFDADALAAPPAPGEDPPAEA